MPILGTKKVLKTTTKTATINRHEFNSDILSTKLNLNKSCSTVVAVVDRLNIFLGCNPFGIVLPCRNTLDAVTTHGEQYLPISQVEFTAPNWWGISFRCFLTSSSFKGSIFFYGIKTAWLQYAWFCLFVSWASQWSRDQVFERNVCNWTFSKISFHYSIPSWTMSSAKKHESFFVVLWCQQQ